MKWEDFIQRKLQREPFATREKTTIECPKCGQRIWKRIDVVLTSCPPQYQYECDCGWVGHHTI